MSGPQMDKYQRAAQFWSVLAYAARNRQLPTYKMMEELTGIPKHGQGPILDVLVAYCDINKLPKLTTLLIAEDDGLPQDGSEDAATVSRHQTQVFSYDWLKRCAPTVEQLKVALGARV